MFQKLNMLRRRLSVILELIRERRESSMGTAEDAVERLFDCYGQGVVDVVFRETIEWCEVGVVVR